MTWTTRTPTQPGWYWQRRDKCEPEIVLIYINYSGHLSMCGDRLDHLRIDEYEWSSEPIKEPEQQKELG